MGTEQVYAGAHNSPAVMSNSCNMGRHGAGQLYDARSFLLKLGLDQV